MGIAQDKWPLEAGWKHYVMLRRVAFTLRSHGEAKFSIPDMGMRALASFSATMICRRLGGRQALPPEDSGRICVDTPATTGLLSLTNLRFFTFLCF